MVLQLFGLILLIMAVDSQKIKGLYYSILKVSVRSDRDPTSVRLRSLHTSQATDHK